LYTRSLNADFPEAESCLVLFHQGGLKLLRTITDFHPKTMALKGWQVVCQPGVSVGITT